MNSVPTEEELTGAIASAAECAIRQLFTQHAENFYYITLITTGEGHAPYLSAWSKEALEQAVKEGGTRSDLEWSYADSPYCSFGEEFFEPVNVLFAARPDIHAMNDEEYVIEHEMRMRAMERALADLDREGLFGRGDARNSVVVNAEVMPPDFTNTERAKRLNPPKAIKVWLEEVAEEEEESD